MHQLAIGIGGLGTVLLTVLFIVLFPLIALINVLSNQFTSNDKLIWVLLIIFLPFLGALLYFMIGRSKRIKE